MFLCLLSTDWTWKRFKFPAHHNKKNGVEKRGHPPNLSSNLEKLWTLRFSILTKFNTTRKTTSSIYIYYTITINYINVFQPTSLSNMQPQEKERSKTTSSSLHHRQLGNPDPQDHANCPSRCGHVTPQRKSSRLHQHHALIYTPPLEIRPYDQVILAIGFVNKYLQQIQ